MAAALSMWPRAGGGAHPTGAPVIVVTHQLPDGWPHEGSTVGFVTESIEAAVERAQQIAGARDVALGSPSVIQQCLNLGSSIAFS